MMSTQTSEPVWVSQIGPSPSSQRPSTTNSAVSRVVDICHLRQARPTPVGHAAILPRRYAPRMRITNVETRIAGNAWKNWLFVRVSTDEGIRLRRGHAQCVRGDRGDGHRGAAGGVHRPRPAQVELLLQRMVRDVYSDGGQIHMAAVAAIEVACWDIVGKAAGQPVHELLGGRVRDRVRAYANGWYRTDRTPEAVAGAARRVVARGLHGAQVRPVRGRVAGPGPSRRGPLDRHRAARSATRSAPTST